MERVKNHEIAFHHSILDLLSALVCCVACFICWNTLHRECSVFSEIGSVLMHPEQNTTAWKILWEIRMPRSLTAIILGGALSVSGFLLQTFFSNPIAGPYILGISSGAKLTVALAMIFFLDRGDCFLQWH